MISQEKIFEKLNEIDAPEKMKKRFYSSIIKTVTYRQAGKSLYNLLFKIEEKYQWPILQKIDDYNLKFYSEAEDKKLVKEFVEGIKLEKLVRESKSKKIKIGEKEYHPFVLLKEILLRRAEIYQAMFDFSKEEIEKNRIKAEKLRTWLKKRRAKTWFKFIGISTGSFAAAGIGYWLCTKTKNK